MSEQIHTTAAPGAPTPAAPTNWSSEFKKQMPVLFVAILTAFGASWWNSQKSQGDFLHRIAQLEKRAEQNAQNISNNSNALQQNAIRLAEIGIIQNNAVEQLKDLKQEQTEIKAMLNRK